MHQATRVCHCGLLRLIEKDFRIWRSDSLGSTRKADWPYAWRVGTGFSIKQRIDLKRRLDQYSRETSAFSVIPKDPGLREAHWINPSLVAEVSFIEWTSDGSIRHPSFQGLRENKPPQEVRRELPD